MLQITDQKITLSTCSTLLPASITYPALQTSCLNELVTIAQQKGKRFINLGLAINKGITFFKQKWGGVSFLNHEFVLYETSRAGIIESLLNRL